MGSGDSETKPHFIRVSRSPEVSLGMFQETLEIGLKVIGIDFRLINLDLSGLIALFVIFVITITLFFSLIDYVNISFDPGTFGYTLLCSLPCQNFCKYFFSGWFKK